MRVKSLIALALIVMASAAPALGQSRPKTEFGIGAGAASYDIDGSYSGPNLSVEGITVHPYTGAGNEVPYPASSEPASINTVFMYRFPIGANFAIAYTNRVAFAFDDIIHRGDYVLAYDDPLLTLYGLTGAEFEYYFNGDADSGPWVAGIVGISALMQPFVEGYFPQLGFGGGATAGWRFSPTLAIEMNGMYLSTSIPGILKDKVSDLGGDLEGETSGFTVSLALRFGFGSI